LCLFLKYPKNISFFFIQYEKLDALLNEVKKQKQKKRNCFKITKSKYKIQNIKTQISFKSSYFNKYPPNSKILGFADKYTQFILSGFASNKSNAFGLKDK